MKLTISDADREAVKAQLYALGAKGEAAMAELDAKGKRQVFTVGGVGVTAATVAALGVGFLLGLWIG